MASIGLSDAFWPASDIGSGRHVMGRVGVFITVISGPGNGCGSTGNGWGHFGWLLRRMSVSELFTIGRGHSSFVRSALTAQLT